MGAIVNTLAPIQALTDAADILETEANELASVLQCHGIDRGPARLKDLPPRVEIAVRTEMKRLRSIANDLRKHIPKPKEDDDENR